MIAGLSPHPMRIDDWVAVLTRHLLPAANHRETFCQCEVYEISIHSFTHPREATILFAAVSGDKTKSLVQHSHCFHCNKIQFKKNVFYILTFASMIFIIIFFTLKKVFFWLRTEPKVLATAHTTHLYLISAITNHFGGYCATHTPVQEGQYIKKLRLNSSSSPFQFRVSIG